MNLIGRSGIPLSFMTKHLLVRRYSPADEATLFEAARESIEQVYPFLPWCHPEYAVQDARDWLDAVESEWTKGSTYSFAIENLASGEFLGGCGLSRIDEHPVMNLGYWIRQGATGKGVATEATVGLATFALAELGMKRVEILMSTQNLASRRVAEKSGAVYEGKLANRLFLHDTPHDAHLFSIVTTP